MCDFWWGLSVFACRWRNRFRYLSSAFRVYRNWWAVPILKLGVDVILELRNGLRYLVRAGTTDLATVNEAVILNPYLGSGHVTLRKDAVVIDVGANIGDFAIQTAHLCPKGRIIAVEPISEHARVIAVQKILNSADNVLCVQVALGQRDGEIEIYVDGMKSSAYWGEAKIRKVRLTTLPQLMRNLGLTQIDLLKLDCEGAEWDILPSSEEILPRVQQICMEFHCGQGWTAEKLATWLRERGYHVWHTGGRWNGLLWAVRTKDVDEILPAPSTLVGKNRLPRWITDPPASCVGDSK